jgi:hypothetical protein
MGEMFMALLKSTLRRASAVLLMTPPTVLKIAALWPPAWPLLLIHAYLRQKAGKPGGDS